MPRGDGGDDVVGDERRASGGCFVESGDQRARDVRGIECREHLRIVARELLGDAAEEREARRVLPEHAQIAELRRREVRAHVRHHVARRHDRRPHVDDRDDALVHGTLLGRSAAAVVRPRGAATLRRFAAAVELARDGR
jgi:hypothetical protein